MKHFLLLTVIGLFSGTGLVRFKQHNGLDPKMVIDKVRVAFPHAHCIYTESDSVFQVDNFVNFDEVYFMGRMQQYGVNVSILKTDEK